MNKLIAAITGLVTSKLEIYKTVARIFQLETRLAALSIAPLLLSLAMLIVALLTSWMALMVLAALILQSFLHNYALAVTIILLFNALLCLLLYRALHNYLRKMSFAKTREYFAQSEGKQYHDPDTKNSLPVAQNEPGIETSAK